MLPSVSVVVPALNEARNLPYVFARMPPDVDEIILVDGFSIDDTVTVARQLETGRTHCSSDAPRQRERARLRICGGNR